MSPAVRERKRAQFKEKARVLSEAAESATREADLLSQESKALSTKADDKVKQAYKEIQSAVS